MKFVARRIEKLTSALSGFGVGYAACFRLLRKKDIKVNGRRVSEDIFLNPGDSVEAYCRIPAEIVYEDENILIADKRAGIECAGEGTLEELLRAECPEIRACHRLDRNTEGLVLYAKSEEAERAVSSLLASHEIKKFYECVAVSAKDLGRGRAEAYLFKDAKKSRVYICDRPERGAKPIATEWKQLERIDDSLVRLEVFIRTGRTHQIRAHLAHLGFPVLGDEKYGNFAVNREYGRARQCLVACRIECGECGELLSALNGKSFFSARKPW